MQSLKKQADDTAIYACSKFKLSQIDTFGFTGSESIWLKIWKNHDSTKALVIASIYRHPSEGINQFIRDFSDCQEKLSNEKTLYILGDVNINIIATNQLYPNAEKYLQAITSNGAFSLIAKPTLVTDKSATVIDHIITNDVKHIVMPFVTQSSITDHYAVMCKIGKIQTSSNKAPSPLYRNKKKYLRASFF